MLFRTVIVLAILFLIDLYVFQAIKTVVRTSSINPRIINIAFWSLSAFCFGVILLAGIIDWHLWPKYIRSYAFAVVFITYFSKLFIVLFLIIDDVLRFFRWIVKEQMTTATTNEVVSVKDGKYISRLSFLSKAGLLVAAIPFTTMIMGMIKGAYTYRVRKVKLKLPNIPESFNGFKIVQISDIHSGSFTRTAPLYDAVKLINEQQADVVFFTGDLVNDRADEMDPYMEIFNKIKAPHGVFSILGNHDYGDYYAWPNPQAKIDNLNNMKKVHADLGWKLMLDEHAFIEKNNEKIGIIGIQNWGAHMRFSRYGDMKKATANFEPASFNVLLSHDPSHWRGEVLESYPFVNLTLSGHTHGMQFGIDIPGFKWSPVQYFYKEWAGMYDGENNQHMYVNRGLGFLGYPGRVGVLPEITVIELEKA